MLDYAAAGDHLGKSFALDIQLSLVTKASVSFPIRKLYDAEVKTPAPCKSAQRSYPCDFPNENKIFGTSRNVQNGVT